MKKHLFVVLVLLIVVFTAQAERPPQPRDKAKLVMSGTVTKLTTKTSTFAYDGVRTDYTAELVVENAETGNGVTLQTPKETKDRVKMVKAGDTITVTWFRVTTRPTKPLPGAYGHDYAIKEKDKAKFWLMDRGPNVPEGVWVVIYNKDGVVKIETKDERGQ
jgi:hypothetical protein